jgi:hypothetical protein
MNYELHFLNNRQDNDRRHQRVGPIWAVALLPHRMDYLRILRLEALSGLILTV